MFAPSVKSPPVVILKLPALNVPLVTVNEFALLPERSRLFCRTNEPVPLMINGWFKLTPLVLILTDPDEFNVAVPPADDQVEPAPNVKLPPAVKLPLVLNMPE